MAFHQSALIVDPYNHAAANELGVLLAKFGQLREARSVLQQSVAIHPLPETWHNLWVVHQRLGEADLARRSLYELERARRQRGTDTDARHQVNGMVRWVDPQTFARGAAPPGTASGAAPSVPSHAPQQASRGEGRSAWSW